MRDAEDRRKPEAKISVATNGSGEPCYVFRYWETLQDGKRVRRKRQIGKLSSMTLEEARKIAKPWILSAKVSGTEPMAVQTMGDLIAHFRAIELSKVLEKEGDHFNPDERAWSTADRYEYVLQAWIEPRWADVQLDDFVSGEVEAWLHSLVKKQKRETESGPQPADAADLDPLAPGTKFKIRSLMSVLFNHARRWNLFASNPISGPERKAGVRQSSKRETAPDILEIDEMRSILPELAVRERALVSVDMITGIRRGELAGLKWKDIDFANLLINVIRSVVDQRTGKCKTEASAKPVPIDEYTAEDLLAWYRLSKYKAPEDWVFASDDPGLGPKRGKQPLWLSKIMQYHIQPLVKRLGIDKRVSWKTFRSTFTSLLTANKENVKVVQELLRHASSKITMDIYAQAEMKDKRRAQLRIVKGLRKPEGEKKRRAGGHVSSAASGSFEVVPRWSRHASKTGRQLL